MQAIEAVTANPRLHTRDLGGTATTSEVTNAVRAALAQSSLTVRQPIRSAEHAAGFSPSPRERDLP